MILYAVLFLFFFAQVYLMAKAPSNSGQRHEAHCVFNLLLLIFTIVDKTKKRVSQKGAI